SPLHCSLPPRDVPSFPTRRSSDLSGRAIASRYSTPVSPFSSGHSVTITAASAPVTASSAVLQITAPLIRSPGRATGSHARTSARSEEHTSELQSLRHLVCRLLLEK